MTILSYIKQHDLEGWLAVPFRWLASWASVVYNGEWRNACAAHIFAGWALVLTILFVKWWLFPIVLIYPIFREAQDSKWFTNWNRKNYADIFTFWAGEVIGTAFFFILK